MLFDAGLDVYTAATRPHTSSTTQRPARVAAVDRPDQLPGVLDEVAALARSRGRGLTVVPQATGHGAGGLVDDEGVLLDTPALRSVEVDPQTRVATVGASAAADTGRTPGSWIEAGGSVPGALPADVRERACAVADAVDPDRRLGRSRLLG